MKTDNFCFPIFVFHKNGRDYRYLESGQINGTKILFRSTINQQTRFCGLTQGVTYTRTAQIFVLPCTYFMANLEKSSDARPCRAWPNSYKSTRVEIGGPSRTLWRPVPAAGRAGATPVALAVVLQTRRVAGVRERDEGAPAGHLLRQSTVQQSSVDTQNTALPSP